MKLDKIRVLLIDDEPDSLARRRDHEGTRHPIPAFGREAGHSNTSPALEQLFELRWLATVEEAREYRDLSSLLAAKRPLALGEDGWVPEILCFDYMMQPGRSKSVEDRLPEALANEVSPLLDLRQLARREGVHRGSATPRTFGLPGGNDAFGCYCGGLILALFGDHPCSPVALTRYTNVTAGTDATFFEWFLELDSGEAFARKGKQVLSWEALIAEGVARLRRRILELVEANLIDLDLDGLLALAAGEERDGLLVQNRFGTRNLPIQGLFCDIAEPLRKSMIADWAENCLDVLFDGLENSSGTAGELPQAAHSKTLDEFRQARDFSRALWLEYLSELSDRRCRLSELVHERKQRELPSSEEAELRRLCHEFEVDMERLGGRQDPPCSRFHELRSRPDASVRMLRWTALLMAVRLELWAASCRQDWRHHHRERGIDGIFDLVLTPVQPNDVYLALFPVPKTPLVTGFHDGKSLSSAWGHFLKPRAGNGGEELGLDLSELLRIKPEDDSDGASEPVVESLLPGEARVLRWFAQSESGFRDSHLEEIHWLKGRV